MLFLLFFFFFFLFSFSFNQDISVALFSCTFSAFCKPSFLEAQSLICTQLWVKCDMDMNQVMQLYELPNVL